MPLNSCRLILLITNRAWLPEAKRTVASPRARGVGLLLVGAAFSLEETVGVALLVAPINTLAPPKSPPLGLATFCAPKAFAALSARGLTLSADRKSTRLNSSHVRISYAV